MDPSLILSVAGISTLVSAAIGVLFKSILTSVLSKRVGMELERLKAQHALELEDLKARLTAQEKFSHELTRRRLEAYPKIVELAYRVHNSCRELLNGSEEVDSQKLEALEKGLFGLEEALYSFRFDLERDRLFLGIHTYKNQGLHFRMKMKDLIHYRSIRDAENQKLVRQGLQSLHKEISLGYSQIVAAFSSFDARPI